VAASNEGARKKPLVTVVDGVMGVVRCSDEILGVDDAFVTVYDLCDSHRIHVMDDDLVVNVEAFDPEVASIVPNDYVVANVLPLSRPVEPLIDPTIKPERRFPDLPMQSQVPEPV
jgi:hypothetical protein